MFYLRFFFRFVGDQTQTSARPVFGLNHEHCDVYSPKPFETLIPENVTHIVFFVVCKKYFLLVLSKYRFGAKQCVRTCKDYVICREITIVLKIAVESVTLALGDGRDYFAGSLLVKRTD